jgi:predicted small secreted protein
MMRIRTIGPAGLLRLFALALVACNALAGIGEPILETPDGSGEGDAGPLSDANGMHQGEDSGTPPDGSGEDAADTSVPDTNVPDTFTPPPPAAKPGFDLTAGGTYGTSASYALIAVVGEGPGGNNVGSSQNYVLKAGVIATTQPN